MTSFSSASIARSTRLPRKIVAGRTSNDALDERPHGRAVALTDRDEPEAFEHLDRLADRRPVDLELLGELRPAAACHPVRSGRRGSRRSWSATS